MKLKSKSGFIGAFIAAALIFFPAFSYGQDSGGRTAAASIAAVAVQKAPPVAPSVVPEGAFAVELVNRLGIGETQDETQAEKMLSSAGIEPDNGWISEYPVTPDVLREIEDGVIAASRAGRIVFDEQHARRALAGLKIDLGLNVALAPPVGDNGRYVEAGPPVEINNFYSEYGPPVVTYYAPPWPYYDMYAWVQSPFWWGDFSFSGFFIFHDFHRRVHFHHRTFVVTNRIFDPAIHRVVVVDPVRRPLKRSRFAGQKARVAYPRTFGFRAGNGGGAVHRSPRFQSRGAVVGRGFAAGRSEHGGFGNVAHRSPRFQSRGAVVGRGFATSGAQHGSFGTRGGFAGSSAAHGGVHGRR